MKEMPYDELILWMEYLQLRPEGWQADNRAAKVMQALGVKAEPSSIFESLSKIKAAQNRMEGLRGIGNSIKNSSLFSFMKNASGADAEGRKLLEGL
jgi:hypothetical protein